MRFIGDIHGEVFSYAPIIAGSTESVQVGDFGVGFLDGMAQEYADDLHKDGRHKFIRGNHDDPGLCKQRPGYIADGTYDERGIFYVGGAWSIDWHWRTAGYTWWPEEELSDEELVTMHDLYLEHRPRIMVTHDAPTDVAFEFFIKGSHKPQHRTRTAEAFQSMFAAYQPETWLFGHWHIDKDAVINGTRFICLGINSYIDLKI